MDVLGFARLCIGGKLRRATGSTASCGAFDDVARNGKEPCGTCMGLNLLWNSDCFWDCLSKVSDLRKSFVLYNFMHD